MLAAVDVADEQESVARGGRRHGDGALLERPEGAARLRGDRHTKLTYQYQGRNFRLTDVHGNIVDGILA